MPRPLCCQLARGVWGNVFVGKGSCDRCIPRGFLGVGREGGMDGWRWWREDEVLFCEVGWDTASACWIHGLEIE